MNVLFLLSFLIGNIQPAAAHGTVYINQAGYDPGLSLDIIELAGEQATIGI